MAADISIIGAGLSGNLLAILLARLGLAVRVYDRGPAPDAPQQAAGRSINLALAARGKRALEAAGVFADIEPLLLPMDGRIVHAANSDERFLRYGQRPDERIWSVSRAGLNQELGRIARDRCGVEYHFEHECMVLDADTLEATLRAHGNDIRIGPALLIGADGAGSGIRRSLAAAGHVEAHEELLDHGYKELLIPPHADGQFPLRPDGLHIWPRGDFMLIALPNLDHSFTATLFLPHRGRPGFDTVTPRTVEAFFAEHFADVLPLVPGLRDEFESRPTGTLGTVHCAPWSRQTQTGAERHVVLIGDAAHAIVPFHGQGMNAAFEDCVEFARLLARPDAGLADVIADFEAARAENSSAIARMALENYEEMRDTVRDPDFEARAAISFELEQRHPGRFIPRYSMVMFHPEIGYAEAEQRGRVQAEIIAAAMAAPTPDAGLETASGMIAERL